MSMQKTEVAVNTEEIGQNKLIINTENEQNNTILKEAHEKWMAVSVFAKVEMMLKHPFYDFCVGK